MFRFFSGETKKKKKGKWRLETSPSFLFWVLLRAGALKLWIFLSIGETFCCWFSLMTNPSLVYIIYFLWEDFLYWRRISAHRRTLLMGNQMLLYVGCKLAVCTFLKELILVSVMLLNGIRQWLFLSCLFRAPNVDETEKTAWLWLEVKKEGG